MRFKSLMGAGFYSLLNLVKYTQVTLTGNSPEGGTVIYRSPFEDGGFGYTYQIPYISEIPTKWSPRGAHPYMDYEGETVRLIKAMPDVNSF